MYNRYYFAFERSVSLFTCITNCAMWTSSTLCFTGEEN